VKPRNLLFDAHERLVVADFGIARAAYEESLTASDELLGTAAYISPEQALGEPATPASDRYAFAVVAFESLTGGLPFGGGTLIEIAQRVTEQTPPLASERSPELPPAVDEVLVKGLAREPHDRWPTAGELVEALDDALASQATVTAPPPRPADELPVPPPEEPRVKRDTGWYLPPGAMVYRPRRRFPSATALLLGLAAALVGALVGIALLGGGDGGNAGNGDRRADRGSERAAPERGQRNRGGSRSRARGQDRAAGARGGADAPTPAPAPGGGQAEPGGPADGRSAAQLNDEGFRLMNAGRYDEAIPSLQRAVAAFPRDSTDLTYAYALYNLGRSLRLAGRPAEAIPILERRLRFDNQRATVQRELAAARRAVGS
jgi:serine/threonine-protein kinase